MRQARQPSLDDIPQGPPGAVSEAVRAGEERQGGHHGKRHRRLVHETPPGCQAHEPDDQHEQGLQHSGQHSGRGRRRLGGDNVRRRSGHLIDGLRTEREHGVVDKPIGVIGWSPHD